MRCDYSLVSVIIPTYNYEHYILDAIISIEEQTYPLENIEVIIVDDGSTDNTEESIAQYQSKVSIQYYYQNNKGKAAATQKGIELASGEILFNLDADDYFFKDKIEKVVNIFNENPKIVHVGHAALIHDENNNIQISEHIPAKIANQAINGVTLIEYFLDTKLLFGGGSTFCAKASIFSEHIIPASIDMYIDEYLIYYSLISGDSYLLSENLSVWRVHSSNYSISKNKNSISLKQQRLMNSSASMLEFVNKNHHLDKKIKKGYYLKHLDRVYGFKNEQETKSYKDLLELILLICSFKYSLKALNNYRIFSKLMPYSFIIKGKKLLSHFKFII